MSAIFKSAAMSLLSRALQTLLSKYLMDVDVEGVNLPSLYDSDGHSGWGVRLKNVKLRRGVKLRDLAGKPHNMMHKRKRRRREKEASGTTERNDDIAVPAQLREGKIDQQEEASVSSACSTDHKNEASTSMASDTPATTASSWWFWRSSSATAENVSMSGPDESAAPALTPAVDSESQHGLDSKTAVLPPTQEDGEFCDHDEPDDEEEEDLPYTLRLGHGGHVAVLDVRLIGSEIHVLVEDGLLTIEAVRIRQPAEPINPSLERTDAKKDVAAAGLPPDQPLQKPTPDSRTVGDRVLAENILARYFAALPNVLLRDLRIQFIIRDQIVDFDSDAAENVDEGEEPEFNHNDSIVEICVEFLSITDGGDFLGKYRYQEDDDDDNESNHSYSNAQANDRNAARSREEDRIVENEYMTKRIRTGRGPEGGVVIRVYPPGQLWRESTELHRRTLWARHSWETATEYCLLRCSGWDVQSRLFLGTKDELSDRSYWYSDEYDYDMEFNIFAGVDYIAPAPQPLPPMIRETAEILEDKFWEYEGAATYHVLDNGIQYSSMKSSFHKVARGMFPNKCSGDHLPCEYCDACWEVGPSMPHNHALDNATPMPGFVLSLVVRDPLELNIDRSSLEVVGNLVSLMKRPVQHEASATGDLLGTHDDPSMHDISQVDFENSQSATLEESRHSCHAHADGMTVTDREDFSSHTYESDKDDVTTSFPSYMQPEKIQIIGAHFLEVRCRIHVMRPRGVWDQGFAYSFWDIHSKCVTIDWQKLSTTIRSYSDWRVDIGHIMMREYKGPHNKQLISCGLRQRVVEFDEMTIETLRTMEEQSNRSPWPSTAAALLDMQPPLETLSYEERDRHAMQLRYLGVVSHLMEKDLSRTLLHARLGPSIFNFPWTLKDQIPIIIQEARRTTLGQPRPEDRTSRDGSEVPIDSLMRFKVHLDGGSYKLEPKFDVRLPLTTFSGERSPESGLFLETILERINFKFNEPSSSDVMSSQSLSLQQLVDLPENIRLSVLLFLDDLGPLARALGVKFEHNTFILCHAVNKALIKTAKRSSRRKKGLASARSNNMSSITPSRRQELMTELLKLDDESLERLWRHHMWYERQHSSATPKR